MIEKQPILITGIPRSGTTIIASALSRSGAFLGNTTKRSMYENIRVRDEIVKLYLNSIGADIRGQFPLPVKGQTSIPVDWRQRVEQVMLNEGYKEGEWMYKGNTMCLMWQVWAYAFPNARWVIVRRRTGDIVDSCLKTGYMNAFSDEDIQKKVGVTSEKEGWLWWAHQYEERFVDMLQEGLNCKIIWPERMVNGDYQQMFELLDWLGLRWKNDLFTYIGSMLWNSRQKGGK